MSQTPYVRKHFKEEVQKIQESSNDDVKIYVASLSDYNSGKLVGEWFDLANYSSAEELDADIQKMLQSKGEPGAEEYAVHDVEGIPRSMYTEYPGMEGLQQWIDYAHMGDESGIPREAIAQYAQEYTNGDLQEAESELGEKIIGVFEKNPFKGSPAEEELAYQLIDDGIIGADLLASNCYVSDTDRRIVAGEEADNWAENEGLDPGELDEAQQEEYDRIYSETEEALNDPYSYFVEEQGIYSDEDFKQALVKGSLPIVQIDYAGITKDLEMGGDINSIEAGDQVVYFWNH
jgi:antirestriction protein